MRAIKEKNELQYTYHIYSTNTSVLKMADASIQQQLLEISKNLIAITSSVEAISNAQATNMARMLSEIKKLAPQPRSRPATSAAAKPAATKFPRTFKAWFTTYYKETASARNKCKDMLPVIITKKPYVDAKEENKMAKEADLAYIELTTNTTYTNLNAEFDKEYKALRADHMKDAGIETSEQADNAPAAAADDAAPTPAAKKMAKKPSAPKKAGAVPKDIDG
jgi:lysophospholipase L1-like esterase